MLQQSQNLAYGEAIDAISRFLAKPPAGMPADVIQAFDALGAKGFLPPKLFLETVEQAPIAISITDPNARILYVNKAFEELTGYPREQVVGQNESKLSSHSTPVSVYQELWQTIQDKRVWRGSLVNLRKNGEEYLAELVISPVLGSNNKIEYFLGMHRDKTDIHQLEQRLKFQKALTEAALVAAPMVIAMLDSDRKVLMDNNAYKALLGDFRGKEPAHLFLEALIQQDGFDPSKVCKEGNCFTNVEVRIDPPGRDVSPRWFVCSGVHVAEMDEAAQNYFKTQQERRCCLLLVANEVTERRNRINDARLNMIRATMTEQQMLQTMRESISAAVFKLQGPFNMMKAALSMQADAQNLQMVLQQAMQTGEEALQSLRAAIPDNVEELESSVNINEILHEVLRLSTEKLLASGIVVDWRPSTLSPTLAGRAYGLRSLFKSLIDNAIHSLNESDQKQPEIRLDIHVEDDELVLEVMDNGPGIPANLRLKVFEPFYCGWQKASEHAGMGLTMAQEVVNDHQGSIQIDPDFLGGCRVFVRLPVMDSED